MIANAVAPVQVRSVYYFTAPAVRSGERSDRLSDKVRVLCEEVEKLRRCVGETTSAVALSPTIEQRALEAAKRGLAIRRRRDRILGDGLFSEPVWDILLELYIARAEDSDVPVGNACLAASVPMTSALRCCQQLQDRKIVYRQRDPQDRRRVFLRISDECFDKLTHLLGGFMQVSPNELLPSAE